MKRIIKLLVIALVAIGSFIFGARYSIKNIYIETLDPSEVPAYERDGSNFYYAIYSEFFKNVIIY